MDRAKELIEDIWCEKIRGCSYRGGNTVLISRDYGASYSMSAMSGVVNTPCDVGSAAEIVGVALANSADPMINQCAANVLAVVDGWSMSIQCWRLGALRISGSAF